MKIEIVDGINEQDQEHICDVLDRVKDASAFNEHSEDQYLLNRNKSIINEFKGYQKGPYNFYSKSTISKKDKKIDAILSMKMFVKDLDSFQFKINDYELL